MKKVQQGFTLIELMIVVAIIGILAAIAIPAYQDYTIRAQVSEGLSISSAAKVAATEYWQDRGTFPADHTEAGLAPANQITGKYVDSVEVASTGEITVTYGGDANQTIQGDAITLTPNTSGGTVNWECAGSGIENKHLPSSCRTAAGS